MAYSKYREALSDILRELPLDGDLADVYINPYERDGECRKCIESIREIIDMLNVEYEQ